MTFAQICAVAAATFAAELGFVALAHHRTIASVWELQYGALWLFPAAFVLLAAAVALWWPVARAVTGHSGAWGRWGGAVALGVFAAVVAYGTSTGRHFDVVWRRVGFVLVAAALAGAGTWLALPKLQRGAQLRPRRLAAACLVGAVLCEAVNLLVLVRLYPAFHAGLSVLTVGCLVLGRQTWALLAADAGPSGEAASAMAGDRRRTLSVAAGCALLVVGTVAAVRPASERLARFDNFRLLLLDHAPLLGQAVSLAARLSPPPPLSTASAAAAQPATLPGAGAAAGGPSLAGRDILLVTIDALRADHVGAYGYPRPTTPHIDRLAAGGARFAWAYCATPHTSYSVTSLMTGKYIRPLLLQGAGADSETWASLLRTYGYRTAAFYPPAVFFIDRQRFEPFERNDLGFEYQKKEFLEGEPRVRQVESYLHGQGDDQKLFVWVHLFGPHEPYEQHPEFDFGQRDVDRYDSEVAAADATVGRLVEVFRNARPGSVVIVSSDHGEEFGEHGGRYHGSSVYEEQVRVPLVISAPGAISPRVVEQPVQAIDLLPTVLRSLEVPVRPRVRGRDLGALLIDADSDAPADDTGSEAQRDGFAYVETDEHAMLARGTSRLVCQRRLGACRLFDVVTDPRQAHDLSAERPAELERLRSELHALNASHGQFERQGLRQEGQGWPPAILRGLAGDGDAALEIAELLDDADVQIRRKAVEVLYNLRHQETVPALTLALQRDEDPLVRRFASVTLTRLGHGASLTIELLDDRDAKWRRRAALSLAESGDGRGRDELVGWWMSGERSFEESSDLLRALGQIRAESAVYPLLESLDDVRLRPAIARALAAIGDDAARGGLAKALAVEPYQTARQALARALVDLGADNELVSPLRRWLGVPDPLDGGLGMAVAAGILQHVGGPDSKGLRDLRRNAQLGELVRLIVPKAGNGQGVRLIVRARNSGSEPALIWVGQPHQMFGYDSKGVPVKARKVPEIHPTNRISLELPPGPDFTERHVLAPAVLGLEAGRATFVVVLAERGVEVGAIAAVPLADEILPPTKRTADPKAEQSTRQAGNTPGNQ